MRGATATWLWLVAAPCACGGMSSGAHSNTGVTDAASIDGAVLADARSPVDGPARADSAIPESGVDADAQVVIPTTKRWPDSVTRFCASDVGIFSVCPAAGAPFYGQDSSYVIDPIQLTVAGETVSESVSGLVW
ncbi:MAG: hypothetical protein ACREJ3_08310, partial [Polyangiaceae bacterium]